MGVRQRKHDAGNGPGPGAGKLQPQDLDAERAVLGGFLLSSGSIDELQPVLGPEQFYALPHSRLCEVIYALRDKNKPVDAVTVAHELEAREWLEDVGGVAYLATLMESVPNAGNAKYYSGLVIDTWKRRVIIDQCTDTLRDAYGMSVETDELVAKHDTATQRLLETTISCSGVQPLGRILLEALIGNEESPRETIPTGFSALDDITGGIAGGNLIVLAGRASMGKTALLLSVILNLSSDGNPCLVFTLEMSALEFAERILSIESKVPAYKLRKNDLDESDHSKIAEASNSLNMLPIHVEERTDIAVAQIGAIARRMKRSHQIKAIAVDYLQLITPEKAQTREQEVAGITRRLKVLAKTIDLPIILLAQLSREVEKRENKRPRLSDLRESGAIEQDADQVWFVHRPEYFDPEDRPGEAEVIVAKNRNGPISTPSRQAWLEFHASTMAFVEPSGPIGPVQGMLGTDGDW